MEVKSANQLDSIAEIYDANLKIYHSRKSISSRWLSPIAIGIQISIEITAIRSIKKKKGITLRGGVF
jgi:hypothetical protein